MINSRIKSQFLLPYEFYKACESDQKINGPLYIKSYDINMPNFIGKIIFTLYLKFKNLLFNHSLLN